MSDKRYARGYRLHVLSIDNRWPLDMELTAANEHAVGAGMLLTKRLVRRGRGETSPPPSLLGGANDSALQAPSRVPRIARWPPKQRTYVTQSAPKPLGCEFGTKRPASDPLRRSQTPVAAFGRRKGR